MKLGFLSLIIRNKKSGQSMHVLTKTKVSEASLTNLHKLVIVLKMLCCGDSAITLTQAIFRWSFYLSALVCFSFLFNNLIGKVWTKKKDAMGKENIRQLSSGGKFA